MKAIATAQPLRAVSRNGRLISEWFGLDPAAAEQRPSVDPGLLKTLLPGAGKIVLITGPSGAGKSSLLRALRDQALGTRWVDLAAIALPDRAVVDCFGRMDLEKVLALLSRVGLAEAWTYLRRPGELSEGQRWRLRLAMGMSRSLRPGRAKRVLACDEFTAVLDRITAAVVARSLRRAISPSSLGALLATSHDDLASALKPDTIVHCDFTKITVQAASKQTINESPS